MFVRAKLRPTLSVHSEPPTDHSVTAIHSCASGTGTVNHTAECDWLPLPDLLSTHSSHPCELPVDHLTACWLGFVSHSHGGL